VKLKDYEPGSMKILLLGPSGSGKTCLACTLGARAWVLDLNNGLASATLLRDAHQARRQECEVKNCWGDDPGAMWRKATSYVDSFIKDGKAEALVIDGMSDLAEAALGMVLSASGKWTTNEVKPTTMQEWGFAIGLIQRLLWKFRTTSKLLVIIAHTRLIEQDDRLKEVLDIYGKSLPGKVLATFDEVWYTKVEGAGATRKYAIQSLSSSGVECKTRRQLPNGVSMDLGMEALLKMVGWTWPSDVAGAGAAGAKGGAAVK
jgi:adenylate kinase family enzyme